MVSADGAGEVVMVAAVDAGPEVADVSTAVVEAAVEVGLDVDEAFTRTYRLEVVAYVAHV